jgi:hypothetical protein
MPDNQSGYDDGLDNQLFRLSEIDYRDQPTTRLAAERIAVKRFDFEPTKATVQAPH